MYSQFFNKKNIILQSLKSKNRENSFPHLKSYYTYLFLRATQMTIEVDSFVSRTMYVPRFKIPISLHKRWKISVVFDPMKKKNESFSLVFDFQKEKRDVRIGLLSTN